MQQPWRSVRSLSTSKVKLLLCTLLLLRNARQQYIVNSNTINYIRYIYNKTVTETVSAKS